MNKWILKNTTCLEGKTVALSGATGGIGQELCFLLAGLGANLILLDRNTEKSNALIMRIKDRYPRISAEHIRLDLEDIRSVDCAVKELSVRDFQALILNAGAYHIPRHKCSTGLDNVFQINFASPYYLVRELLPKLKENGGKVVAVGSIAHNYSRTDLNDIDFSTRKQSSLAYGNAKRFLMFALYGLFDGGDGLSVVHPGITFTNITNHYPKLIFAIIKHPMKIIFMKPKKASLSILYGVFEDCRKNEWIGPRLFNVWGLPKKQKLSTCPDTEAKQIFTQAEIIYRNIKKNP